WARAHINFDHDLRYLAVNDAHSPHEDLRLMYKCKHHIIANSTFSWWGAWLSPSPDKIVIAPGKWFNDPAMNRQAQTIVPESWIRL
ncbi:MAG TPA: alpha-1,2-fucosyltransferase, partial [Mucilaginibacter sp.]|nr:alpha-1,2-fucosyltransferase [Mucilaginibacter sp.]